MWGLSFRRMMRGNKSGARGERQGARTRLSSNRGQSAMEYTIIIAALCAVIISMQIYTKRAVQGRLKASANSIGPQFSSRWSALTTSTTTQQHLRNVLTEEGASSSTLLDDSAVQRSPYVDRFSDKKLTEEKLFE